MPPFGRKRTLRESGCARLAEHTVTKAAGMRGPGDLIRMANQKIFQTVFGKSEIAAPNCSTVSSELTARSIWQAGAAANPLLVFGCLAICSTVSSKSFRRVARGKIVETAADSAGRIPGPSAWSNHRPTEPVILHRIPPASRHTVARTPQYARSSISQYVAVINALTALYAAEACRADSSNALMPPNRQQ